MLELLKSSHKLGLISNARPSLKELLDLLDLGGDSESVVISALAGTRKPDASIFRMTLGELGVEARDSIFMDDV